MKKERNKFGTDTFSSLVEEETGYSCRTEWYFHPTRLWRFDYAIIDLKIAIEIDGGVWVFGRHNRPSGYLKDCEKFNAAAELGWVVLRFTPQQRFQNETFQTIKNAVKNRQNETI